MSGYGASAPRKADRGADPVDHGGGAPAGALAAYLSAERELGRIAADADVDTLAATLIGAVHLLFADRNATPPEAGAVGKVVTTVLAGVLPR